MTSEDGAGQGQGLDSMVLSNSAYPVILEFLMVEYYKFAVPVVFSSRCL